MITMTALRNKLNYSHTRAACCLAYVTQSVAAMFMPLLFVRFGSEFGLSMDRLTALVTVTFLPRFLWMPLRRSSFRKRGTGRLP